MIWSTILQSRSVRWLGAAFVAVLGFVGIIAHQRRDAARDALREVEHEYEAETARRILAGGEAVRRGGGSSPDDRVRASDAKWPK